MAEEEGSEGREIEREVAEWDDQSVVIGTGGGMGREGRAEGAEEFSGLWRCEVRKAEQAVFAGLGEEEEEDTWDDSPEAEGEEEEEPPGFATALPLCVALGG